MDININKKDINKKILIGFLSVGILSFSLTTAFAMDTEFMTLVKSDEQVVKALSIEKFTQKRQSYYNSFTGKVIEIRDHEGIEGGKFISVENEVGIPANIILTKGTYVLDNAEIKVGSTITGYYKADAPMIMIYPAQYKADVIVVGEQKHNIKIDLFDEELISKDIFLELNITENTEIVTHTGNSFNGNLANRKLIVLYGPSTKSIPAQTNPVKIIVLPEEEKIDEIKEKEIIFEEEQLIISDVSKMNIVVENKKIQSPPAYVNKDNVVMLPLKAICKELGYQIKWNEKDKGIRVGNEISFKIGVDEYIYKNAPAINLGTAPKIVNNRTFVPISFFREVLKMNNAYVFEGEIHINNGEKMQ
ncbi:MAG: copper amine oxidase N-terminal domain-containing protein [Clostridiales bacterium]|nr:copper amine oxidase N-terminal domain-containing protein [Clostridiales bacterium]